MCIRDSSTTARVIDQEATWRWGLLGGKSRMRLLVKTTDADAEASFALMQPSEVGGAKSATLRGETTPFNSNPTSL